MTEEERKAITILAKSKMHPVQLAAEIRREKIRIDPEYRRQQELNQRTIDLLLENFDGRMRN